MSPTSTAQPRQEWPRLSPAQLNPLLDELFSDLDIPGLTEEDIDRMALADDGAPQRQLNFHDL